MGREWDEEYPPLKVGTPPVDAFLAYIEDAWSRRVRFQITHSMSPGSGRPPHGAGGGVPAVAGAAQTGGTLLTDGWSVSTANVMRAGDMFNIAGVAWLVRVLADADSDAAGAATIAIAPPIPAGSSPADNALITRTGATLTAYIASPPNLPVVPPGRFLAGLTLTFREAL